MIQAPINVSPQNTAVTLNSNNRFTVSGVFKGDKATQYGIELYDADNDSFLTPIASGNNTYYNDDTFNIDIGYYTGRAYKYTITFSTGTSDLTGCDMYIGKAHLQNSASSGANTIYIEAGIDYIYNFGYYANSTTKQMFFGAMIVAKIGNSLVTPIVSYNTATGATMLGITLDSAYSSGTEVKLYANYITTRPYYVKIAETPTLTMSATNTLFGYQFDVDYSASGVYPKSYEFGISGDKSGKVYSTNIQHYYPQGYPNITDETTYSFDGFTVSCVVEFANGVTATKAQIIDSSERTGVTALSDYTVEANNDNGRVHMDWTIADWVTSNDYFWSCMSIYRKCLETGEETYIGTYFGAFGDNIDEQQGIRNVNGIDDVTAANGLTYEYALIPTRPDYESTISVDNYIDGKCYTKSAKLDVGGWTITAIYPRSTKFDDGTKVYQYGDTWKFIGDISDISVSQNTGKTLNTGSEQFPILTETDLNYASGAFTALLTQIVCPDNTVTDDITLVKAWRKFITQHCQFILKSIKGDVWVVNVTDNPSTAYQNGEKLTSVSFNWAECEKIENITVYKQGLNVFGRYIDRLG